MKRHILSAAMSVFTGLLLASSVNLTAQLLQNTSFEAPNLVHWDSDIYVPGTQSKTQHSKGKASVLIAGTQSPKMISVCQYLNLKELPRDCQTLKFSCDIFPESFEDGTFYPIYLRIHYGNKIDITHVRFYPSVLNKQLGAWQTVHHFMNLKQYPNLRSIQFMILATPGFTGRIFLDDVQVNPWTPPPAYVTVPQGKGQQTHIRNLWQPKGTSQEPTEVTLSHDQKALDFNFTMKAFALNPISNQLSSFKANIKERDKYIWLDDSVEIRLQVRRQGLVKRTYYVGFNANGAIADMYLDPQDGVWRDAWNGDITVDAARGNGQWTAHVRIAKNSLKIGPKEECFLNIIRFNHRIHETSTLIPNMDIQDMGNAAQLILADSKAWVQEPPYSTETLATQQLTYKTGKATAWELACIRNGFPVKTIAGMVNNQTASIPLPADIQGTIHLQVTLLDNQQRPLWRSPLLAYSGDSETLRLNLKGGPDTKLFVNGKPHGLNAPITLTNGATVLAIETKAQTPLSGYVTFGKQKLPLDQTWKCAVNQTAQARQRDFDDSSWNQWSPTAQTQLGKGTVILRKTFLKKATQLSPVLADNVWRLTHQNSYRLCWPHGSHAVGPQLPRPLKDFKLVLEYSDGLKFAGLGVAKDSPYLAKSKQPGYTTTELPMVKVGNYNLHRLQIAVSKPIQLNNGSPQGSRIDSHAGCHLIFDAVGAPNTEGIIRVHCLAEQGNIHEITNSFNFQILPKLKNPRADGMTFLTLSFIPEFENTELNKKLLRTYRSAGFNELWTRACRDYAKEIGLNPYELYYPSLPEFKKHGITLSDPKTYNHWLDPSVLTRTPGAQELLDRDIARYFKQKPYLQKLWWDFEFSPMPSKHSSISCRSKLSQDAFKKEYNIKETITTNLLETKYRQQWIDFSCSEVANMFRMFSKACVKAGKRLDVYSGYQAPSTKEHYSVDWEKFSDCIVKAYCGYGDNQKDLQETRKALKGTPMVMGLLKVGDSIATHNAATIFRMAVLSRSGVLLWYENPHDGLFLSQVEKAVSAAASCQSFLLKGQRDDSLITYAPHFSKALAVLRQGKQAIVVLLNESSKNLLIQFQPVGFTGTLKTVDSTETYDASKTVKVNVPKESIIILKGTLR